MLLALLPVLLLAKTYAAAPNEPNYLNYIQNKGQWESQVLYRSSFRGGVAFLEKAALTFLFYENNLPGRIHDALGWPDANTNATAQFHTVQLQFSGTVKEASLQSEQVQPFYHNYFIGNDRSKWSSNVPVCQSVTYKGIYNGIDVKVFGDHNNVRYDFIVAPGADPSAIQLTFTGQDRLYLNGDKLVLVTSVGQIEQSAPYAYQKTKNGVIVPVSCEYILSENTVKFIVTGNYDKSQPLIIDPTLVFATYTGSTGDNWGLSASYDMQGNGYTAGQCFAPGYPVTTGAFQSTFMGNSSIADMSISKFSPSGSQLLFSTYLGGSALDSPHSITVDNDDNLVVFGRTYSHNFPVKQGCFSTSLNGLCDIVLTRFNASGTALLASTFIGGAGIDGQNTGSLVQNYGDLARGAVHVDENNDVYVASCTASSDFPLTPGCFQAAKAGAQDACVFKMDAGLSILLFSTYLGGSANDAAYNFSFDSHNTMYITGGTQSSNFPVTPGALHTSPLGGTDGFISHLSLSGNSLLHSSYVGTSGYDQSYFIQTDKRDNIYLYGQSEGNYPITSGVYANPGSGQFIHKLDPTLSSSFFSSQFGSGQSKSDISPSAFLVDNCGNIYVSGWGGIIMQSNTNATMSNMPLSGDALQSSTDNNDFYFAVFTKNMATLHYGTYFGGPFSEEHVDGGTSCYDKGGVMYQAICASCGGNNDLPTTPGVWSNVNGSPNCNNALVKFKMDLTPTVAQIILHPFVKTGCVPFTVNLGNNSINAITYKWDFGDGSTSTNTTTIHTFSNVGTYTISLIAYNLASCNQADTTHLVIKVKPPISVPAVAPYNICKNDSVRLQVSVPGATSFSWTPSISLSSASVYNPLSWPLSSQVYLVVVKDSVCHSSNTATVQINVHENQTHILSDQTSLCANDTIHLKTTATYSNYLWSNGKNSASISIAASGLYTVTTIDSTGCKGSDSLRINSIAIVQINSYSLTLCKGQSAQLSGPIGETYKYRWLPATFLSKDTVFNPIAKPDTSTNYLLTIFNNGCKSSGLYRIVVHPLPGISVSQNKISAMYGEEVVISAITDLPCYWYPGDGLSCDSCKSTIAKPENSTLYTCRVSNKEGCMNTSSVYIDLDPTFYVPNCFTPNNDGLNDVFRPVFTGYRKVKVSIYDRWGTEIYTYDNLDGGWNGMYQGSDCKMDVYVYTIDATDLRNKRLERTGFVTLLR